MDKKYFPEFQGTNLLKKILGENTFSYPKSLYAVLDTLKIMTSDDDIVLDFFAGSGTTAHAALELNKDDGGNRQFILCEQLDYMDDVTIERIKRVLENNEQGMFTYCELMSWNEKFIKRIQAAQDKAELQAIWEEMQERAFLSYRLAPTQFDEHAADFAALSIENQKRFLMEVLDKNQLYVNLCEMDDETYGVSEADKRLNKLFYQLG